MDPTCDLCGGPLGDGQCVPDGAICAACLDRWRTWTPSARDDPAGESNAAWAWRRAALHRWAVARTKEVG